MIFGIDTTRDISKLSQILLAERLVNLRNLNSRVVRRVKLVRYNNLEISLAIFMPNITTNHAITYTKLTAICLKNCIQVFERILTLVLIRNFCSLSF